MRQRLIRLQFHHLRINDHKAQFFGRKAKEHAGNQRVDANAFPAACGAGYQQMRHLRQVGDDRLAVNVFAECEGNSALRFRFFPICRFQQLAQCHRDFARVRELDADGVLAGDRREDVDSLGAGRARQIALEADDLVHSHAFGRINFVARDRRTFRDVAGRNCDTELPESVD